MKRIVAGLLLPLLHTILSQAQSTILHTPASLSSLPLVYTGKTPVIFLPDQKPAQPYIATHTIEVAADETNALFALLKERGKAEGVDAILLFDLGQKVVGPNGALSAITGVGIKYTAGIDYLDHLLRQRVVTTYQSNGTQGPTVILNYNWRGSFSDALDEAGHRFMADSILPFDAHPLLLLKPEMYDYQYGLDNKLRRVKAKKVAAKELDIQWVPSFATEGNLTIKINDGYNYEKPFDLAVMKDQQKIVGTAIKQKGATILYTYFEYDILGRVVAEKWYKIKDGKKWLWLSFDNRFQSNDPAQWPQSQQ